MRLIVPTKELPFLVGNEVTSTLASVTLEDLKTAGKLFYLDYSRQHACSAYFFIHPETEDFLPLAMKTNSGADLTYTPLDEPNDCLLANMMFKVNDMFHGQMLHLVITHDVSEGVQQAALHTMSEDHPILIILDSLML